MLSGKGSPIQRLDLTTFLAREHQEIKRNVEKTQVSEYTVPHNSYHQFSCRPPVSDDERHIANTMLDYEAFMSQLDQHASHSSLTPPEGHSEQHTSTFITSPTYLKLRQQTKAWLLQNVELIQQMIPSGSQSVPTSKAGKFKTDNSIYVGCGGTAYLHWKLCGFFKAEGEKEKVAFHSKCAVSAIECALALCPKKPERGGDVAFYIGSAGTSYRRNWVVILQQIFPPSSNTMGIILQQIFPPSSYHGDKFCNKLSFLVTMGSSLGGSGVLVLKCPHFTATLVCLIATSLPHVGLYALSVAIYWISGHLSRTEQQARSLLTLLPSCLSPQAPDEILFGRAGYLFCLLFVQKHSSEELCERMGVRAAQRQVFDAIMESGKRNSGVKHPETG